MYQRLLSLIEMVFVSRATPNNPTPLLVFLSTEIASTRVPTSGCFYSFFVPGERLTALAVDVIPVGSPAVERLQGLNPTQGLQIDTTTTTTTIGNTTVTRQVRDIIPETVTPGVIPGVVPGVVPGPALPQPVYQSPIYIIIEVEGGGRCHHHERDRWFNRRVTNILITDNAYLIERQFEDDFW